MQNVKHVAIDDIQPYPGNPRQITMEAVRAVRTSIEKYGYVQPLVVDADLVVIVGHTRLLALKELGYTHIDVVVADKLTPQQVKEYRLADNRTAEFTSWDTELLTKALDELSSFDADIFFPDLTADVAALDEVLDDMEVDEVEDYDDLPDLDQPVMQDTAIACCPRCSASVTISKTDLYNMLGVGNA